MPRNLLDEDRTDTVRLTEARARAVAMRALERCGYDEAGATIITDQLVDNALCGYKFASLPRILTIAEEARNREARAEPFIVRETPSSALVDGGNTIGYIAAFRGAEIAARKAKETGLSIVGVFNSFYSGRNAWYVETIVKHDLVAIHTCSASPRVLPPGSRAPLLGTNPIAIGFPSTNGPIVWDIGTASVMWGDVQLMARLGHELPEGTGFDQDGKPTRDAAAALSGAVGRPQRLRFVVLHSGARIDRRRGAWPRRRQRLWLSVHRDRSRPDPAGQRVSTANDRIGRDHQGTAEAGRRRGDPHSVRTIVS